MAEEESSSGLQWVNSTTAKIQQDGEVRTKIRKQAMKQVARERKLDPTYGKINLRQYPVVDSTLSIRGPRSASIPSSMLETHQMQLEDACDSTRSGSGRTSPMQFLPSKFLAATNIPAAMSPSGYEAMIMKYSLQSIDLSILTSVEIGRHSAKLILGNQAPLAPLLKQKLDSFFSHLPARFGYSSCLSYATECAIARVCQMISPASRVLDVAVVSLYAKALQSLQMALRSAEQQLEPDVLCAAEILALYEVMLRFFPMKYIPCITAYSL
jgi:hypothetical protein